MNLFKDLAKLKLSFDNPSVEKEYIAFNRCRTFDHPWGFITSFVLTQTFLLLSTFETCTLPIKAAQSCLLILTFIIMIFRKKLQNCFAAISSAILILANLVQYINIGFQIEYLTPLSLFFQTYGLGAIYHVFYIWLCRFKLILIPNLISLVCRTLIFSLIASEIQKNSVVLSGSIIIDLIFLYSTFIKERNERKSFKRNLVFTNDTLSSKEQLVFENLPYSILIVNQSLQTGLFSNKAFNKAFCVQDGLNEIFHHLETLFIYKDDFSVKEDLPEVFEDHAYLSIHDFLVRMINLQKISEEAFTTYACYEQTLKLKKLFEVKIMKLKWIENGAIILFFNEITRQAESLSMKAINTHKEKLISTVSHELKTPIHGILTMLTLGLQSIRDPEALIIIDFCKKSTLILLNFVQCLIDLQLIINNRIKLRPSLFLLENVVNEVISLFELHRSQKGITLIHDIADDIPKQLYTDQERLKQILVNLVGNAVKFTHHGGIVIKIRNGPESNGSSTTLFEVEDTGIGMTELDQKRIFKMYNPFDNDEDHTNLHGIGIGLTISNDLVKLLNNKSKFEGIKCVSEYNKGSVFSFKILNEVWGEEKGLVASDFSNFLEATEDLDMEAKIRPYNRRRTPEPSRTFDNSRLNMSAFLYNSHTHEIEEHLPLRKSVEKSPSSLNIFSKSLVTRSTLSPANFNRRKGSREMLMNGAPPTSESRFKAKVEGLHEWVLIVDDSPLNLLVAKKFIQNAGFQAKTAVHGQDAISKIKEHIESGNEFFRLILMDCQMPVMDGHEATKELKAMMAKGEIPQCKIVALTANDTEEDIQKCKDSGMDDVFSKPMKEVTMQKIVEYINEKNI